uniref:Uncharacterized protein n=1 Tax=Kalanchoe fedtschenkoi TaxID=63787 RepID=A0A7N0T163_KALFE
MSDVEADERLLLRDIKRRLRWKYGITIVSLVSSYLTFPIASYILKNVAELRLDGWKKALPSVSDERRAESTDAEHNSMFPVQRFREYFHEGDHYLREIMELVFSTGVDEHKSTLYLLETLRRMDHVDNILILILTSFALGHGAWLLALKSIFADSSEQEDINMVLKSVVISTLTLRGEARTDAAEFETGFKCMYISLLSSTVRMPSDGWKSMESLYNLIRTMLDVTKVFRFLVIDLSHKYILRSLRDEFDDLLCLSSYWIVHGVVACSSQCNALPKNGYVIQDSQKLIYVYEKLTSVHRRLQEFKKKAEQFEGWNKNLIFLFNFLSLFSFHYHCQFTKAINLDDNKIKEAYRIPRRGGEDSYYALIALFGKPQLDRSEGSDELKLCRSDKNDMDLSISSTLKGKMLLMLISGLEISSNEVLFLRDTYIEPKTSVQQDYEVVWVPILSGQWTTSSKEKYTKLLRRMPWHMVEHPNFISEETKNFIKQVWKFERRPIVVVINKDGDVVYPNVIHMMYIWGSKAFPFTSVRERTLWYSPETRLESLVFDFDPNISRMPEDGKWVILYGGNNVEWSRKFTTQVRKVLSDASFWWK